MSVEGHEVGSRGWDNKVFTAMPTLDLLAQIKSVNDILFNTTGTTYRYNYY